ncbi:hypothetical protein ACIPK7_22995 [Pseudomonas sp. NPDC086581]|uniref:hypothetical protein n=1 Tax=Pseudomonas sp. NPDC086581 TaxID=3364432 RepID=UPI0037F89503
MNQPLSAPVLAGSAHRVKPTALALHIASAPHWGRPWRRRALSLPSPRDLSFQGVQLSFQPLRSWLHLLTNAGMLSARPSAVAVGSGAHSAISVLRRPEDDDDAPARIEELGFELTTEMILDFANFARQSRLHDALQQVPVETEAEDSGAELDELLAAREADGAQPAPTLKSPIEGGAASEQGISEAASMQSLQGQGPREAPSAAEESLDSLTTDALQSVTVLATTSPDRPDTSLPSETSKHDEDDSADETPESVEVSKVSLPLAAALVQLSELDVMEESSPFAAESSAQSASVADSAEQLVEPPLQRETVLDTPELAAPEASAEADPESAFEAVDAMDGQARDVPVRHPLTTVADEPAQAEGGGIPELSGRTAPAFVVSGIRAIRKVAARPQPTAAPEPVVQRVDVPVAAEVCVTATDAAIAEPLAISVITPAAQGGTESLKPETADVCMDPGLTGVHLENMGSPLQPNLPTGNKLVLDQIGEDFGPDEFSFEPMIASLEDALAVLSAASVDHDAVPTAQVDSEAATGVAGTTSAPLVAEARRAEYRTPEAAALQGIFIQKETEMTEMRDEISESDVQGSAPIASVDLLEVATTLSVPQFEADSDDVLSDVQSTLNSLAGMAQGLTQQKQAAGRLQEELEEWDAQLQERERLAGDKEERLLQLETHLKEAKTNLDRMAAENNRLLSERSEALKELAQTVDLRDKSTTKRAESIQLEQQHIDEQVASLRIRASELDERESALKRKSEELGVRLKQLQSAKDKFSAIVKSFNETVQFNSTLSAISKAVNE